MSLRGASATKQSLKDCFAKNARNDISIGTLQNAELLPLFTSKPRKMTKVDTTLYEGLIKRGQLNKEALEPLIKEAQESSSSLFLILRKYNLIPEPQILKILSEELNISYQELKSAAVDKSIIDQVSLKVASYYKFLPLRLNNRVLTIAVSYPLDLKIQDEIRTQLGYDIAMVLSPAEDIVDALKRNYGLAAETLERISSGEEAGGSAIEITTDAVEDIEKLAGDASVIKLVNQIILEGWKKRSTDIHIEPYRRGVHLRYRIDGLLYDANVPPEIKNFLSAIISRIKIMSNLNIVERRLPQDGRAVVRIQEHMLDLRISTIPTPFGESLVIRLLPANMLYSLEKLGLPKKDLQTFEMLIQKPHGVIFVTGPTGSGKTTTLYTCLSRINTRDRKIITIEDPIEYEMSGITQIQVIPEIGLDFARGLRSVLRHDPDVIMVGEVRDLETAEIAIRVALTGHLVFSTLHTNDAASGITRLIDIGVEPYLLSSSVEAFIAQRLIRVICQDCKYEDKNAPGELKSEIARESGLAVSEVKVYRGKGCANCNFTGFFGRTAIYEILLLDDEIRNLVVKKTPSNQIKRLAIAKGMRTLRQDGWQKVISGLTTPEEIMKVTSASEKLAGEMSVGAGSEPAPRAGLEPAPTIPNAFERRVFIRLDNKVNLRYKVLSLKEGTLRQSFNPEQLSASKNISAGGLVFTSDEPLAVGAILELRIELAGAADIIECLAKVIRTEEKEPEKSYDIAVCFLDISGAQRLAMSKYVSNL